MARRHLKPGGYIEHAEFSVLVRSDDGSSQPGDVWDYMGQLAIESSRRFGKPLEIAGKMANWIREAGFGDVHESGKSSVLIYAGIRVAADGGGCCLQCSVGLWDRGRATPSSRRWEGGISTTGKRAWRAGAWLY